VYITHIVHYVKRRWLKYAGEMREKEKMTETVTIRLTASLKAALQAMADADRRKLASFLSLVLEEYVEKAGKGAKPKRGEK
jgi:hypothetical protein